MRTMSYLLLAIRLNTNKNNDLRNRVECVLKRKEVGKFTNLFQVVRAHPIAGLISGNRTK